MQYINNKKRFIIERFDMSGDASGPLGNDINWGDSLVGRLLNSISRKIIIGNKTRKVETIAKRIEDEFNTMLGNSAVKSSGLDKEINKIKISYILGELRDSVREGRKVKYLIDQTENLIKYLKDNDFTKELLTNIEKNELLKKLNDFLDYLKQFNENEGETEIPSSISGLEDIDNKEDIRYSDMIKMLSSLANLIDNVDSIKTSRENEASIKETNKNIKYVLNRILNSINEYRPSNEKFNNDLLSKSNTNVKWPIIEISENSIIYRKTSKIIEIKDGNIITNIPKYDEVNKRYVGDSTPKILPFNRKTIERVAKYIYSKLNDIEDVIKTNKYFKPTKNEIDWFNKNIKGKWVVTISRSGNWYKSQIGNMLETGEVLLITPPVKGQTGTSLNTIIGKGFVVDTKEQADKLYDEKYKSGENVLSKKSKPTNISKVLSKSSNKSLVKNEPYFEPIEKEKGIYIESVLFENVALDIENHLNQALSKLKSQIKTLTSSDKGIAVTSKLLKSIVSKSNDSNYKLLIKSLFNDIRDSYNRIGAIGPLYESIENINDRKVIAEKIARFAKRSMQFEGENFYASMSTLGKELKLFNNEFKKLISVNESLSILRYSSFIKENTNLGSTDITSDKIRDYFYKNMDYDRWVLQKTEVEKIKNNVEQAAKNVKDVNFDSIIEIVKLFNKAYKLYTIPFIQSGRSDGRVSNKTYREYTYLGRGTPGGPDKPGYGPWRNNKMFDRFESKILDILKESKFRKLFDENTSISIGNSKMVKGGGKILLNMINNLLDGNELYKSGEQSKFIKNYFNLDIDKDKLGNTEKVLGIKSLKAEETIKIKNASFQKVLGLKNESSIYAIKDNKNIIYYLAVIATEKDWTYIKYSKTFYSFSNYLKSVKITNGDIDMIDNKEDIIYYSRINSDSFKDLKISDKMKLNGFSIQSMLIDSMRVKPVTKEIVIDQIYRLLDDNRLPILLSDVTNYGKLDSDNYKKMNEILKR